MKKKRKKRGACTPPSLNLLQGLGSAPDVPLKENYDAASFAVELFGAGDLDRVEMKAFKMKVAENVTVKWNTVIYDKQMFISIPSILSPVGSKESFISLLEIAEEDLGCENVICCVQDKGSERSVQLRTFMYMGFQPIPPTSSLLPSSGKASEKYCFLGYEL